MPDSREDLTTIRRREARSGRVSYGDPEVLHETTRRRVVFVPFFINRSEGSDLAVKLVTYGKAEPAEWVVLQERSLSLDAAASRKLLRALQNHLRVAEEDADGSYILLRVNEGTADLGEHDPKAVATALTKVLSSSEVVEHLADTELSDELLSAFRGAIRLSEMRSAVTKLRRSLDSGENDERVYQEWCEAHSWAFGNAYVMRDEVREISPGDRLDLLLPTVISGYRDVVELKRPDMAVLHYDQPHRNFYFSADASRAIGQCHRYLDVLHEVAAQGLRDHPEVVAYHPRGIVVIGRSISWSEDQLRALHGLNRRLTGLTLMTYDQLLAQGERLIAMLSSHAATREDDEPMEALEMMAAGEEDIPF